ncbi:MAG: hypothetical protein KJ893_04830 [Candidatus Omnitrophica bacterium]|nr:hypothetical protein [Candidatus Omnitrophota bacterium]MBU4478702.1 hypothetical protein [Candidatus Omnitrophota bacterium]MCG2703165.1 hypothetical protein [Candidatus Omnitrophota bacterium]
MFELLEKIILAGVGLANLTKEKAEALVETLIEKGQVQAKDKKAVLNRLLKGAEQLDRDLEKKIKEISLNIVKNSQKQIDALHNKLAKLSKDLEAEKEKSKQSKPSAAKAKTKKKKG